MNEIENDEKMEVFRIQFFILENKKLKCCKIPSKSRYKKQKKQ